MNSYRLLGFTLCTVLWAANATAGQVTLEECLLRAHSRNSGLKATEMAIEAAEQNKQYNRAAFFPSLKMRANYSLTDQPGRLILQRDSLGPGAPAQDTNLADQRRDNYQAALYLLQPLFTGGNLSHSYKRSGYQLLAAESDSRYQRELLNQNVKKYFYEALAANVRVTACTKSLHARENLRRIAKDLLAEGYITKGELLVTEASLTEAEAKLILAQNQADLVMTKLRQLINAPPEEALEPAGELSKLRIDTRLSELLRSAGNGRHDLQALALRVRQSDEDISIAKSGFYPNISLKGEYLRQQDTNVTRPNVLSAMLSAEWSLFDWGRTVADVRRTRALNRQDTFKLEEMNRNVMVEVEELWRHARTELSQLLSIEARLKSEELALQQAIDRRKEGKVRQADVLNSEASLWQAYGEYYQSAAVLNGVVASLERATAIPLDKLAVKYPLYKPDFSVTTGKIAVDAAIKQIENTAEPETEYKTAETLPTEQLVNNKKTPSFRLQFGVFSQQANAKRLIDSLSSQHASKLNVSIVSEGALYKVMSDRFASRNEALETARRLELKTYLIKME